MSIIGIRRLFLSRAAVLLLLFLVVFSGNPPCFIPVHTVSASSWDGIDTIAIIPSSDEFLDTAAQELKTYLEDMSGRSWTIVQGDTGDPAIRLDVNSGAPEFTDRNDEAVRIISDASGIRITGKTSIATRHGAYILLDKLGVRWFFKHPAWEVVPTSLQDIGDLDEIHEPAFIWRRIWHPVSEGMNRTWDWRRRNHLGGAADYQIRHSYREFMPLELYGTYPDAYLPEGEAPSGTSGWQVKPDHPEVISRAIAYADNALSAVPGSCWYTQDVIPRVVAPISPNDGYGWGTYEQQDPSPPPYQWLTDKVVGLTNTVAASVASSHPGKYVGVYNYSKYSEVPSFDLEPNVIVEVTTAYDITELTDVERINGLRNRGATVATYDYYDPWVWMKEDIPYWSEKIWNRLKLFAAEGVKIYTAEGGDSWGSAGATYYVASKLAWNPSLAIDDILADFYTRAFGPATGPMSSYYERWFGGQEVTENSLALAFRDLWEAQQLAADHPDILERIRHIQYYMRYRWLSSQVSTMSLEECKDFYTFATQLRTLYILYYTYVESSLENELRNNRGLSDGEISALYDETPPTEAQANAWMNEALTYFEDVDTVDANYIDPTNMALEPLGDQTLPRLAPATGERAIVLVDAQAGDTVELMLRSRSPYSNTTFEWCDTDGNILEEVIVPASGSWQPFSVAAPVTGRYKLTGNGSIDVINHPAGSIDGLFHASQFYLYVPEGTTGLLLEFEPQSLASSLYDPTGALAFTFAGDNGEVVAQGVENPQPGVWRLSYGGSAHTTSGFQIYGVPDLIWHDPEYLLVPAGAPDIPVAYSQSVTTNVDTPVDITLSAYDPNDDPLTYTIVTGPSNGTLSGTPPVVTYTPNPGFSGSDSFTFKVNDSSADSNVATVSITVTEVNNPPMADTIGDKSTNEGELLDFTISAIDPDGDQLVYSASDLPSGASFDSDTQNFSWTPRYDQAGLYSVYFEVSDGQLTDSENVTITVVQLYEDWDINGDGAANVLDMVLVGQHWGEAGLTGWIREDANEDGAVNVLDMIIIGQNWTV